MLFSVFISFRSKLLRNFDIKLDRTVARSQTYVRRRVWRYQRINHNP